MPAIALPARPISSAPARYLVIAGRSIEDLAAAGFLLAG
jgi:hypothetical protein